MRVYKGLKVERRLEKEGGGDTSKFKISKILGTITMWGICEITFLEQFQILKKHKAAHLLTFIEQFRSLEKQKTFHLP